MKNVITATAIALLFGLNACKNVDEKLVTELQQGTTTLENSKPASDSAAFSIDILRTKVAALPAEKVQAGTYAVNIMQHKFDLTMADYNATKEEVKTLLADYEAGKIQKEEVEAKYKVLQNKVANYEKSFQKLSKVASRPTEELVQMGEERAKSEGMNLSKPASADQLGGSAPPPAATGADGGGLQGDGSTKKREGGK